jgi:hypothetical protein
MRRKTWQMGASQPAEILPDKVKEAGVVTK